MKTLGGELRDVGRADADQLLDLTEEGVRSGPFIRDVARCRAECRVGNRWANPPLDGCARESTVRVRRARSATATTSIRIW